ncbi:S8 family serine peptidase [Luteitalea sp.]|uniref:S8 family serine peptidase n=1 Tax=Luteitalea sp. TaxID=2004800 RepID=UPI0025BB4BC2|nr:S8 family serine peptidase [Luteitalea sp.]
MTKRRTTCRISGGREVSLVRCGSVDDVLTDPARPELHRVLRGLRPLSQRPWLTRSLDDPSANALQVLEEEASGRPVVATGAIAVGFADDVTDATADGIIAKYDCAEVRRLRFAPQLRVVVPTSGVDVFELAGRLQAEEPPGVIRYAEVDLLEPIGARGPDPQQAQQWMWHPAARDARFASSGVSAIDAWRRTRGAGVTIAMIDHGFHLALSDIAPAVTADAAMFQTTPYHDAQLVRTRALPTGAHGTFCASLAVARANNGVAGCGVAPEASLMPIACLGDSLGSQLTLARAVAYAAAPYLEGGGGTPADVIVCSLGPDSGPWHLRSVLHDALRFASASGRGGRGTPIFWAVANEDGPIAIDEVNASGLTIPVGACGPKGERHPGGHGRELAFLAPGHAVLGLLPDEALAVASGTSYAAPIAAGIAALVLSIAPNLTGADLRDLLQQACVPCAAPDDKAGHTDRTGFGRLDAGKAVALAIKRAGSPVLTTT